tara:strand:+ start:18913 stop:19572 length:660 start_codon:yes stop_codon:yes gene_type:complete
MSDWGFYHPISESESTTEESGVPEWVLLEPLDFQKNWKNTAGKRPVQSRKERKYYENIWKKNTKIPINKTKSLYNKDVYSNTYSKLCMRSFNNLGPYGIQIPYFRIVTTQKSCFGIQFNKSHAEYLILIKTPYCESSKWYRYNDIKRILNDIIYQNNYYSNFEYVHQSWRILRNKMKYYRCLNYKYLKMKSYLLERVFHDMLYEITEFHPFQQIIFNNQ